MDNRKVIITISREFGSGGRLIGELLAKELGIAYYDRKLIEMTAERSGLSPDFIARSEEQASSSFLFSLATSAHSTGGGYFMQYDVPVGDKAFFAQAAVIREVAEKESCVIVGRCAGYILKDDPDCINVFIHGSLDDRLRRAIEVYGLEPKGLADKLVKADKGRANYHKYYTGESWSDIRAYDLAINTAKSGVNGAVQIIQAYLNSRE